MKTCRTRQPRPWSRASKCRCPARAIAKSAAVGGENSDIDNSGLPENIQQLLKMIRKIQKEIIEKKAAWRRSCQTEPSPTRKRSTSSPHCGAPLPPSTVA
uniref:Uncharacterized protein n=1 Tax=Pseudomonas putida TaxID=303 RepID=Q93TV5_PSEPU|nr:unknown [Pseudomonas putida]